MVFLSDFDYNLPEDRIAQAPVSPRDHSKLLVVDRQTGELSDKHFYDLVDMLTSNDVLVVNDTKVFPARLLVQKVTGKPVELLLEREVSLTAETITWECMTKPGLKLGDRIRIPDSHIEGECVGAHDYTRTIVFFVNREHFFSLIDKWAKTPIPPYIKWEGKDEIELREKYQTVYANRVGAIAAPTAGLHFTPALLAALEAKGVAIHKVTLHVGLGTFLPVKNDDITTHHMHSEEFELSQPVAESLNQAKLEGKRIITVGTTTVRVLESCADENGILTPQKSATQIFVYPPYKFTFVDSLLTNFHTPKSTLLMLISAFTSFPNTKEQFSSFHSSLVGKAYQHALSHAYRFYSFGDAMWIQ